MKYSLLIVFLFMIVGVFSLVGLVAAVADMLRRRRGDDRDRTVIADTGTEFEEDVGKPAPGPE